MNDDLTTLASAYLDGATTAAERAQVESDPELLGAVERLRQVRAVLGDTETAPISVRERHLAGALDAWDRLPATERTSDATPIGTDGAGAAGGASITAPTPLRERRAAQRPVSTRMLTAAAAVVVLVGAGLVVRGALDSGSSDDTFSAPELSSADADDSAAAEFESGPLAAAEETFDEGQAADEAVIAAAPAPASDAVLGGPEEPPGFDDLEVLSGNDELAEFANRKVISRAAAGDQPAGGAAESGQADVAEDAGPDTTLPPPVDLCDLVDEFVGFALWETSGLFDEPIFVGINNTTGEAIAYRDDPCTVIARTPLPEL